MLLYLLIALLPPGILLGYVLYMDRLRHEPWGQLLKGFLFGGLSILLTFFFAWILTPFYPESLSEGASSLDIASNAFFSAALPEESAKLLMLCLLLWKSPHFDEKLDGIVYSVCVGLGFASFENIIYLLGGRMDLISMISRGILSVPGHFCYAVIMGYYFSRRCYGEMLALKAALLAWGVPVLLHTLYDTCIFHLNYSGLEGGWTALFVCVPFFLVILMLRWSVRAIRTLHREDEASLPIDSNNYRQ